MLILPLPSSLAASFPSHPSLLLANDLPPLPSTPFLSLCPSCSSSPQPPHLLFPPPLPARLPDKRLLIQVKPSLLCSLAALPCNMVARSAADATPSLSPAWSPSPRASGSAGAGGVWHRMGIVGERVAGRRRGEYGDSMVVVAVMKGGAGERMRWATEAIDMLSACYQSLCAVVLTCATTCAATCGSDLQSNALNDSIPDAISHLTALTGLHLSNNQLSGAIPPVISALTALQELYLAHNMLTDSIPTEIGSLVLLQHLGLDDNKLGGTITGALSTLTNLTHLSMANNELEGSIPGFLSSFNALTHLLVSNNSLSGAIPPSISGLSRLLTLYVSPPLLGALLSYSSAIHMTTFSRLPPQFLLPSSSPVPPQFLVLVPPPGSSPFPLPRSLLLRLPLKSFPLQTSLPSTFRHLSFHPPWFLGQDAKRQRIGVSFPHKDLSKNKFSEDFPTFLTRMKQVQHITPHITASPLLPYPNPHLRRRLSHNNFTGSIPASISSLASLTYLYAPLIHRPAIFPPTPT
ncbi:unnamed protein product [Closterium sp. NIES-64]|nr:unnamed protein product [Closterium sp. NIES-64]